MFLTILHNVQYLGKQGLTISRNSEVGNFDQLIQRSAKNDPHASKWLERKRNKYVHGDYQNEIFGIMTFIILRDITKNTNGSHHYFTMAN